MESKDAREWTPASGLLQAVAHELLWGALFALVLTGILWVAAPGLNFVAGLAGRAHWLVTLSGGIVAAVLTWRMWSGMEDVAGFTGPLLGAIAFIAIVATSIAATWSACTFGPLEPRAGVLHVMGLAVTALLWIVYDVLTE